MSTFFETNPGALLAADFDYFRLPREQWELMLLRLKQMGANAVVIALPWGFHEFQRGAIDLNGATSARRDVVGLLNLCAAFKLNCLLNLGPYHPNDVLEQGLPAWLGANPDTLETALPSAVEGWYRALSRVLSGQQWPAGPIIALQIESEPAGGSSVTLDRQLIEVKWRVWLRKRYDGVEALNAAYQAHYRTVNDVVFPKTWANAATPLEQDAQAFLNEARGDKMAGYVQILTNAGWQVPLYPSNNAGLPPLQAISLATTELAALEGSKKRGKKQVIWHLRQPFQVDPDPIDIGCGPVWAANAPLRADGAARPRFWRVRQALWAQTLSKATLNDKTLSLVFKEGLLVMSQGETPIKIETTAAKLTAYRLRLSGELAADNALKLRAGKWSGIYVAEDEAGQTDLVFALSDPSAPLSGFLLACLSDHLTAQAQTLRHCAVLTERLGQMLVTGGLPETEPVTPGRRAPTSPTLEEARRGLSEADAALRRAMTSINALAGGFAAILGKEHAEAGPQPAAGPVAINPDVFEGVAKDILIDTGAVCADLAPRLKAAAATLQNTLNAPFTIDHYQQNRAAAAAVAHSAREVLLPVIAKLRLEIAAERLPLVVWRIHNQAQAVAENLRWGMALC